MKNYQKQAEDSEQADDFQRSSPTKSFGIFTRQKSSDNAVQQKNDDESPQQLGANSSKADDSQ